LPRKTKSVLSARFISSWQFPWLAVTLSPELQVKPREAAMPVPDAEQETLTLLEQADSGNAAACEHLLERHPEEFGEDVS
jgi:hypothetical protein